MRIDILTLFPEMFSPLKTSLLGKAIEKEILQINIIDIREFSLDKHHKCDDTPFGGGAGMLMTIEPISRAFESIEGYEKAHKIYMSPKGKTFNQKYVNVLSKYEHIIFLCGHYEGVDERVIELFIDEEISIGDYVLTGGELPAMVVIDAIARFVPEVLGSAESVKDESFSGKTLEYPQYTRPQSFRGLEVPDVLLSGHHKNIEKWRREKSVEITNARRPDMKEDA
ncbi:MAG: tRNA (guanosine(37)-N1)-methyltransferase TrmD [Clostridia bacterium]